LLYPPNAKSGGVYPKCFDENEKKKLSYRKRSFMKVPQWKIFFGEVINISWLQFTIEPIK